MPGRDRGAVGRVLKAVAAYTPVAAIVWLVAEPIRQAVLLPPSFLLLARGATLLFLPVVVAVAWRYPRIGVDASSDPHPGASGDPQNRQ